MTPASIINHLHPPCGAGSCSSEPPPNGRTAASLASPSDGPERGPVTRAKRDRSTAPTDAGPRRTRVLGLGFGQYGDPGPGVVVESYPAGPAESVGGAAVGQQREQRIDRDQTERGWACPDPRHVPEAASRDLAAQCRVGAVDLVAGYPRRRRTGPAARRWPYPPDAEDAAIVTQRQVSQAAATHDLCKFDLVDRPRPEGDDLTAPLSHTVARATRRGCRRGIAVGPRTLLSTCHGRRGRTGLQR
jgi:hypothetical protein